jgi:hypothetical protein
VSVAQLLEAREVVVLWRHDSKDVERDERSSGSIGEMLAMMRVVFRNGEDLDKAEKRGFEVCPDVRTLSCLRLGLDPRPGLRLAFATLTRVPSLAFANAGQQSLC